MSCTNFMPILGKVIKDMGLPIVYAQDGKRAVEYNKAAMSSDYDIEMFWSKVKGIAIARQIDDFYSQYEGQSWKNIISIGDSTFERMGTYRAVEEYMKERGLTEKGRASGFLMQDGALTQEVVHDRHVFKIRAKTFKFMDQPTAEELS